MPFTSISQCDMRNRCGEAGPPCSGIPKGNEEVDVANFSYDLVLIHERREFKTTGGSALDGMAVLNTLSRGRGSRQSRRLRKRSDGTEIFELVDRLHVFYSGTAR